MNTDEINRELNHASWRAVRPLFLALVLVFVCILAAVANAAGTVTDSNYVLLQRSGVTQTPNPASITECLARMVEMIEAEKARRTSGYITYKCLDVSQSYVKFTKVVVVPPSTSVTLSWTPTTQNTDGTSLTNLAGYRIVYGTSATALTQTIEVPNAGVSSYFVENLAPATYFFAVRAYTTAGIESANSNIASKAVQ